MIVPAMDVPLTAPLIGMPPTIARWTFHPWGLTNAGGVGIGRGVTCCANSVVAVKVSPHANATAMVFCSRTAFMFTTPILDMSDSIGFSRMNFLPVQTCITHVLVAYASGGSNVKPTMRTWTANAHQIPRGFHVASSLDRGLVPIVVNAARVGRNDRSLRQSWRQRCRIRQPVGGTRGASVDVKIFGPCQSACTVLLGTIPPSKICIAPNASFGFHLAKPPSATATLWSAYQADLRAWIDGHGGLKVGLSHK